MHKAIQAVSGGKLISVVLMMILLTSGRVGATHLRSADIDISKKPGQCGGLTYVIRVRVYVNLLSRTNVGTNEVNFGDGTATSINARVATARPDLGPNIGVADFIVEHTYNTPGTYKVSFTEGDRNDGILNIPNSGDVRYSTYVEFRAASGCNNFPRLTVPPLDRACRGVAFLHNPGAVDDDGDSLSYALTIPSMSSNSFVTGYISPVDRRFYIDFNKGNEAGTGPPSMTINPETGQIIIDAPGLQGEYNIAFVITEWRKTPGTDEFVKISATVRDMQIVVEDCLNNRPLISGPDNICIEAGQTVNAVFSATDPENHPLLIEVFASVIGGAPATLPATFDPATPVNVPSNPPAVMRFRWDTNCIHVRDQAYQVVIKVTDIPPRGPKLVTFKTYNIRVIAPKPVWTSAEPDLVQRTAKLAWAGYNCANAEKIQVWRKVGSSPFTAGVCVAGLSVHRGYKMIGEFDPSVTSFTDDNGGKKLAVAAQYCYRLVAVFPLPGGGKSYVSDEICVSPILADAPVLTHVSVDKTTPSGTIRVAWIKPPDISSVQFPEPYEYEVYRSEGFSQDNAVNISGRIPTTTFYDITADSKNRVYNYQIVLYSRTAGNNAFNAIDTSAAGSTVRLTAEPGTRQIRLMWSMEVPWSNVTEEHPYHYIYRGVYGDEENDLELIDSVDVREAGFEYTDNGKFNNSPLREDEKYSYYVVTRGTYGNPRIPVVFNKSQMASLHPENNLPLCVPVLTVEKTDCGSPTDSPCRGEAVFENRLSWSFKETAGCRKDVESYTIYVSTTPEDAGRQVLVQQYTGTSYIHAGLPSQALCYQVQAIGEDGNPGQPSVADCNDNCPFFSLPNVFTPNGDGCNDVFSSFPPPATSAGCPVNPLVQCPRFVSKVHFTVLNRWGRVMYEYNDSSPSAAGVNWDGRDKNGTLLASGVYYYTAEVAFDAIDPSRQRKRYKGIIHLSR